MKRLLSIGLLALVTTAVYALPMNIKCEEGTATQRVNGTDTLFIFRDEIHVQSLIGDVDWYATETGTLIQGGAADFYPDDGGYYIVKNGVEYSPFYVFLCKPADLQMSIESDCGNTILELRGDALTYSYTRRNGTIGMYKRACIVEYNELTWNTEEWIDSAVTMQTYLAPTIALPPLYGPTEIHLNYDGGLRDTLGLEPAIITVSLKEENIRTVNMHLNALATARENDPAGNNELNRPIEQDIIKASMADKDWSGALEVAFYSNPTPAAMFYTWHIYHTSSLIATRRDKDIRYSFSEPGSYRVVCSVNNAFCTSDSMELKVNISESYLKVPNVFTPDGNGQNDEFRVAYRSLREFHCWVYNRWGKLVFEWTDPDKGWDGTINGRPAAEGAYFYVIRAMGTDAAKDASYVGLKAVYNKRKANADESVIGVYQLSGDINLIRIKK